MIIDYKISIEESKVQEFLQIIANLKNLGVVKSALPFPNLALSGEAINPEILLNTLIQAEQEIAEGKGIEQESIKELFEKWKKNG